MRQYVVDKIINIIDKDLPLGLRLEKIKDNYDKIEILAEYNEYCYYLINLKDKCNYNFNQFTSITAFIPHKDNDLKSVIINSRIIKNGCCIILNNTDLEITSKDGNGIILIAGTKLINKNKEKSLLVNNKEDHYTVQKPWGHELWINYGQTDYSFKEVYIKKSYQTSLQYHEFKKETAIVYEGICEVIFKNESKIENNDVQQKDLAKSLIEPISIINVEPLVLHRIKALSNIYHYEVSTPFLDDVIRVDDDSNRKNGKILTEHTQ